MVNIEVILADDHPIVRDGIKAVIEKIGKGIKVIGEASTGDEVLEMAKAYPADVYILDIAMPILNGIETADRLIKLDSKSKIIILSMHDNKAFVEKSLKCGAKGYLLKENATDEVVHAICEVYKGRIFLSPNVSKYIVQGFLGKKYNYTKDNKTTSLTRKEKEVLQLIAEGFTNKEISRRQNISLNTTHVHRNNIMQKLNIHKQANLIRYAIKEGISQI